MGLFSWAKNMFSKNREEEVEEVEERVSITSRGFELNRKLGSYLNSELSKERREKEFSKLERTER